MERLSKSSPFDVSTSPTGSTGPTIVRKERTDATAPAPTGTQPPIVEAPATGGISTGTILIVGAGVLLAAFVLGGRR